MPSPCLWRRTHRAEVCGSAATRHAGTLFADAFWPKTGTCRSCRPPRTRRVGACRHDQTRPHRMPHLGGSLGAGPAGRPPAGPRSRHVSRADRPCILPIHPDRCVATAGGTHPGGHPRVSLRGHPLPPRMIHDRRHVLAGLERKPALGAGTLHERSACRQAGSGTDDAQAGAATASLRLSPARCCSITRGPCPRRSSRPWLRTRRSGPICRTCPAPPGRRDGDWRAPGNPAGAGAARRTGGGGYDPLRSRAGRGRHHAPQSEDAGRSRTSSTDPWDRWPLGSGPMAPFPRQRGQTAP